MRLYACHYRYKRWLVGFNAKLAWQVGPGSTEDHSRQRQRRLPWQSFHKFITGNGLAKSCDIDGWINFMGKGQRIFQLWLPLIDGDDNPKGD